MPGRHLQGRGKGADPADCYLRERNRLHMGARHAEQSLTGRSWRTEEASCYTLCMNGNIPETCGLLCATYQWSNALSYFYDCACPILMSTTSPAQFKLSSSSPLTQVQALSPDPAASSRAAESSGTELSTYLKGAVSVSSLPRSNVAARSRMAARTRTDAGQRPEWTPLRPSAS